MLSEDHKRGLRLCKTIYDLRGQKKFKKRESKNESSMPTDFDVAKLNPEEAKKIFR
jgi:hypothetical protein